MNFNKSVNECLLCLKSGQNVVRAKGKLRQKHRKVSNFIVIVLALYYGVPTLMFDDADLALDCFSRKRLGIFTEIYCTNA